MSTLPDSSHRPWPIPARPWALRMGWDDLLFLHWPVSASVLRPLIPASLEIETFDGSAWLGVVPFRMERVRLRVLPPVPTTHAFPELNVRTYVRGAGRSGVWFFSLDAASRIVVRAARWSFDLPYFDARMHTTRTGNAVRYASARTHANAPSAEFVGRYAPTSEPRRSTRGSLEHWLTERYCLFSATSAGRVRSAEILHPPWLLQDAEVEIRRNTMAQAAGIALPATPPLAHFARRIDVVSWIPKPIAHAR